jgi:hypothetical protein
MFLKDLSYKEKFRKAIAKRAMDNHEHYGLFCLQHFEDAGGMPIITASSTKNIFCIYCINAKTQYIHCMKYRTIAYLKRKQALRDMLNPTSIKKMLKAGFYASANPVVKRDILQVYSELNSQQRSLAV